MKFNKRKRLSLLAMALSISTMVSLPVSASSLLDDLTYEETTEDYSEETTYRPHSGLYLDFGTAKVRKKSSNEVAAGGITQCFRECEHVELTVSLERKINGSYATYRTWDFSEENVAYIDRQIVVIVPKNYYYRVRTYHAAQNEGVREATVALTKGVMIN